MASTSSPWRRLLVGIVVVLNLAGVVAAWWLATWPARLGRQTISLEVPRQVAAGGVVGLRALVEDRGSHQPQAGVQVTFSLGDASATAATNDLGLAATQLRVPDEPGELELRLEATQGRRVSRLSQTTTVVRSLKALLTCDKPVYQPGQTIHLRALALRCGDGHAAAGETLTFQVQDPRGSGIFQAELETNDFGVAATTVKLAELAGLGGYRALVLSDGTVLAERYVEVARYVLPTFKVELRTDRTWYHPGDEVTATVAARYFHGQPVAGAKVVATVGADEVKATARPDGIAGLSWRLAADLPNDQPLAVEVRVTDTAGHVETVSRGVPVSSRDVVVQLVPEGCGLAPGVVNLGYLLLSQPDGRPVRAAYEVLGDEQTVATGTTDDTGLATVKLKPPKHGWQKLAVKVGQLPPQPVELQSWDGQVLLVRPDRAVYRLGDECQIELFAPGQSGLVDVDLVRDGQVLVATAALLQQGRGSVSIPLAGELTGSLLLAARLQSDPTWYDTAQRRILVLDDRDLRVSVVPQATQYRPGGTAKLGVKVVDREGQSQVAAVGLDIVDESVFSLPGQSGGARVATLRLGLAGGADLDLRRLSGSDDARARMLLAELGPGQPPETVSVGSYRYTSMIRNTQELWFGRLGLALGLELFLVWLALVLRWRRLSYLVKVLCVVAVVVAVACAVLCPTFGKRPRGLEEPAMALADTGPPSAPAAGAEPVAGAAPAGSAPRLRCDFPETLYSNPLVITDQHGEASVDVPLADSITTWRISALANTEAGQLGSGEGALKVFQPFFVDLDLPATLSVGDGLYAPVVVSNYLDVPQTVSLVFEPDPAKYDRISSPRRTITVPAHQVVSARFSIKAQRAGEGPITVTATANGVSDAVRRSIRVEANGMPVEKVWNGRLLEPVQQMVNVPEGTIPGATELRLKLYPSVVSQLVDGVAGLLKRPYGCFEQTSSVTYPDLLALSYLKETGQSNPDLEAKAQALLTECYQRLLTFESPSGGFDWQGHDPGNTVLSAYGLAELTDLSEVRYVDPHLLDRTRQWLVGKQQADGSWVPDAGTHTWPGIQDELPTTAYVIWSLAVAGGEPVDAVRLGVQYLSRYLAVVTDPYLLALCANALVRAAPGDALTVDTISRVAAAAEARGDLCNWPGPEQTLTYGAGPTGVVETSALATLALIEARVAPEVAANGLTWLVAQRQADGDWGSTQATVLTLKALVAAAREGGDPGAGQVTVTVNGEAGPTLTIEPGKDTELLMADLTSLLVHGTNQVILMPHNGVRPIYQLGLQSRLPFEQAIHQADPAFALSVNYDRREVVLGDIVRCRVRCVARHDPAPPMPLLEIGLPPGCQPIREDLQKLVDQGTVERFELAGSKVVFYLTNLPTDGQGKAVLDLSYRLVARAVVRGLTVASRASAYYNPSYLGYARPAPFAVALTPPPKPETGVTR